MIQGIILMLLGKHMERKFGIEIEAYGVTRSVLVNALQAEGLEANLAGYGQAATPYWKVSTDASIRARHSFELVSPVLAGDLGMAELGTAIGVLVRKNAKVNQSCGLHVHIDATNMDIKGLRNVLKSYANNEDIIDALMPSSRRGSNNTYCRSLAGITPGMTDADRVAKVKAFFAEVDRCQTVSELQAMVYARSRYVKLNLLAYSEHGSIEFRQHSGTVNRIKIVNWVTFCEAFVSHAAAARAIRPWNPNRMSVRQRLRTLLRMIGKESLYGFYSARITETSAGGEEN
jgi:hypothetical protein